ncbi:hypothetical protein L0Z72_08205 [candidate division KSB1 bacterium]|nr:hypothetical protein [candidate division KSB1 bacterium]
MSETLGNDVIEFTGEFDKMNSDIHFLVEEIKEDVQKTLEEFRDAQASHLEHIQSIEQNVFDEIRQMKGITQELQQNYDSLKTGTKSLLEQLSRSNMITPEALAQLREEYSLRFNEIEQLCKQLTPQSNITPEHLREELINGIRMLGERVSKAIADINQRMESLSNDIVSKASQPNTVENPPESEQNGAGFASLKESDLFEKVDFEIVPNKAINKLTELFKKQSEVVRKFVEKHEQRVFEFEHLLRTYDEENTRLLELLDKRVNRNFRFSLIAILLLVSLVVILRII